MELKSSPIKSKVVDLRVTSGSHTLSGAAMFPVGIHFSEIGSNSYFQFLPNELLQHTFNFLDTKTLQVVSQVSHQFYLNVESLIKLQVIKLSRSENPTRTIYNLYLNRKTPEQNWYFNKTIRHCTSNQMMLLARKIIYLENDFIIPLTYTFIRHFPFAKKIIEEHYTNASEGNKSGIRCALLGVSLKLKANIHATYSNLTDNIIKCITLMYESKVAKEQIELFGFSLETIITLTKYYHRHLNEDTCIYLEILSKYNPWTDPTNRQDELIIEYQRTIKEYINSVTNKEKLQNLKRVICGHPELKKYTFPEKPKESKGCVIS